MHVSSAHNGPADHMGFDEDVGVIDLIYLYSRCTCLRYYRSWPKLAEPSEGSTTSEGRR
jgi:hypothetical protein